MNDAKQRLNPAGALQFLIDGAQMRAQSGQLDSQVARDFVITQTPTKQPHYRQLPLAQASTRRQLRPGSIREQFWKSIAARGHQWSRNATKSLKNPKNLQIGGNALTRTASAALCQLMLASQLSMAPYYVLRSCDTSDVRSRSLHSQHAPNRR
jgi:hypothetical protein